MPGIAGIVSREPRDRCCRRVARMVQSMMHEPFYRSGFCASEEIGVYAGWVMDPASSAAVAAAPDDANGTALAFAGESFHESGETVQALYRRLGVDGIARLNGAFSGLIVDRRMRRAVLFNDRYAAERLYVHQTEEVTYFATEAKALLSVLPQLRALDDDAVAELLAFGCTSGPKTLFRGIQMLPGASLWVFEGEACRKTRYFEPAEWEQQDLLTAAEFDRQFQERFIRALPRYVKGLGRIGVSLTGGLDTRMIMAGLPIVSPPPICYTFCGLDGETLDAQIASRVADACGLEHHLLRIGPDFLANFGRYVDRTISLTDGCAGALTAHEVYLNAAAREFAAVRLTGNFGSEIFRSMSTFKALGLAADVIAPDFRPHMAAAARVSRSSSSVTFAAFEEVPLNLFGTMAAARSQIVFRTPYLDNDVVSLAYQAPAAVRTSAASALAFVHAIAPRLSTIPTDRGVILGGRGPTYAFKRLLSQMTFKLDYLHQEDLPRPLVAFDGALASLGRVGVLGQHKYLPYRRWFRHELAPYVTSVVTDPSTARLPYLNNVRLRAVAHDHISGHGNYVRELNAALTLAGLQRMVRETAQHDSLDPELRRTPLDEWRSIDRYHAS